MNKTRFYITCFHVENYNTEMIWHWNHDAVSIGICFIHKLYKSQYDIDVMEITSPYMEESVKYRKRLPSQAIYRERDKASCAIGR